MFGGSYWYKVVTSVYNTDFGNGMVIYGDDYVKSGRWVFDCKNSRVINREREHLPIPLAELSELEEITIGRSHRDAASVKEVVNVITTRPEWYKDLKYLYSGLGENSNIEFHKFFLLVEHAGLRWALEVYQFLGSRGKSRFVIVGERYDPETFVDYTKAFEAAVKSCPAPQ